MTQPAALELLIPHIAPTDAVARTVLLAIRRLAIGGLDDAHATSLFMGHFGMAYRRPLMFLRVLMAEVSRIAQHPITIAPSCCPRMTEGEAAFLLLIDCSRSDPLVARAALSRVTSSLDTMAAVSVSGACRQP